MALKIIQLHAMRTVKQPHMFYITRHLEMRNDGNSNIYISNTGIGKLLGSASAREDGSSGHCYMDQVQRVVANCSGRSPNGTAVSFQYLCNVYTMGLPALQL